MSQHMFTTLRQFVLSRVLRNLPLRPAEFATPEPKRAPAEPEVDALLFDAPRPISAHMGELAGHMTRLSGTLGQLRGLISNIASEAPLPLSYEPVKQANIIWSDADLFDGEPLAVAPRTQIAGEISFLFEDKSVLPSIGDQPAFLRPGAHDLTQPHI